MLLISTVHSLADKAVHGALRIVSFNCSNGLCPASIHAALPGGGFSWPDSPSRQGLLAGGLLALCSSAGDPILLRLARSGSVCQPRQGSLRARLRACLPNAPCARLWHGVVPGLCHVEARLRRVADRPRGYDVSKRGKLTQLNVHSSRRTRWQQPGAA